MKKVVKKLMSVLPQNTISNIAGSFANSKRSKIMIRPFAKCYKINTNETEKTIDKFASWNEFFTRKLRPGARPIESGENVMVSPVDGTVSEFGPIQEGKIIQAKGLMYSVGDLLGKEEAEKFKNGLFMTIYLSPSDYHRIHMPTHGKIRKYRYFPGSLYPVNKMGVETVDGLFTKNERVVTYFNARGKQAALAKVGAFIVGSVKLSYASNEHSLERKGSYEKIMEEPLSLHKGMEVGYFEFGSTVILVFEKEMVRLDKGIEKGTTVKMGQKIGEFA